METRVPSRDAGVGIKSSGAALPQHIAERLCLSGQSLLIKFEAAPRTSAAEPAKLMKVTKHGKPEAYRRVLRQSRKSKVAALGHRDAQVLYRPRELGH